MREFKFCIVTTGKLRRRNIVCGELTGENIFGLSALLGV